MAPAHVTWKIMCHTNEWGMSRELCRTYEWVMSPEWCHTYETAATGARDSVNDVPYAWHDSCDMTHLCESCHISHIKHRNELCRMRCVTHVNTPRLTPVTRRVVCRTYEWVCYISLVTHMNESCHQNHVTYMKALQLAPVTRRVTCCTYGWVMSHESCHI